MGKITILSSRATTRDSTDHHSKSISGSLLSRLISSFLLFILIMNILIPVIPTYAAEEPSPTPENVEVHNPNDLLKPGAYDAAKDYRFSIKQEQPIVPIFNDAYNDQVKFYQQQYPNVSKTEIQSVYMNCLVHGSCDIDLVLANRNFQEGIGRQPQYNPSQALPGILRAYSSFIEMITHGFIHMISNIVNFITSPLSLLSNPRRSQSKVESSHVNNKTSSFSLFGIKLPSFSMPTISIPKFSLPKISIPSFSFPKINIPKITIPSFNFPAFNFPKINWPKINLPQLIINISNTVTSGIKWYVSEVNQEQKRQSLISQIKKQYNVQLADSKTNIWTVEEIKMTKDALDKTNKYAYTKEANSNIYPAQTIYRVDKLPNDECGLTSFYKIPVLSFIYRPNIQISNKAYNCNGTSYLPESEKSDKKLNFETTVSHELGHSYAYTHPSQYNDYLKQFWNKKITVKRVAIEDNVVIDNETFQLWTAKDPKMNWVSAYGGAFQEYIQKDSVQKKDIDIFMFDDKNPPNPVTAGDPAEAFAEAISFFSYKPEYLKQRSPTLYKFINDKIGNSHNNN